MAAPSTSLSLSLPTFPSLIKSKPTLSLSASKSSTPFHSTSKTLLFPRRKLIFQNPLHRTADKPNPSWRICVEAGEALPLDSPALDNSQLIVPSTADASSNIISLLLFVAFIGLSILTIGIVYIGVTDFLQKREGEKFEKEEATKKKKVSKKKKMRARNGPRGFGQKIEEEDENE